MKTIGVLLLLCVALASAGHVKLQPRGSTSGGRPEHEMTNRAAAGHADHSRHHEHSQGVIHHMSGGEHRHHQPPSNRPAEHAVHKKLLQQQQEDELLQGERLMHVRPRLPLAPHHHNNTIATGSSSAKHSLPPLSKKAQKFALVVAQAKATSAAKTRFFGKVAGAKSTKPVTKLGPMTKEYKAGPLVKDNKGRRGAKKYNPKKHAWKKAAHKEKLLRSRQLKRELKERNSQHSASGAARTTAINKEIIKAKELLKKEKSLKKRERRQKRARTMAYRNKD